MEREALEKMGMSTKAVHGGWSKDLNSGSLQVPIYQTSTFIFDSAEQGGRRFALEEEGYIYTRLGNPTNTAVEQKLALLEGAEAGLSFSSGMGAITSVMWTLLKAGDHVISDKTIYGCTFAYLNHGLTRYGVEVSFVDTSNIEEVKAAMKPNTRVLYLETPANPTLKVVDIKALVEVARQNPETKVVIDNTFATPILQRPIELGVDVVVHSATKYINGHGDVIAGFALGTKEFIDEVRFFGLKDMTGAVLSPNDAFLINRGLKTLEIRMKAHCAGAMKVAEYLEKHPKVEKVYYPGLKSNEYYDLAKRQMLLPGAMMAFEVKSGFEGGKTLINNVKLMKLAVSLGDCESLIQHPASMTHSPYSPEERLAGGITDGLIRLSVGLEDPEDIIADLEQAFDKI